MNEQALEALLAPYNPWWFKGDTWRGMLPDYDRPVVSEVLADLRELPQMISITGPRRVGKSTAVKQIIGWLISQGVQPSRILYFSFDDPEIFASPRLQADIFDLLVDRMRRGGELAYLFLDEVQRLPRWELFLKKYYDLKYRLRFVVSGSASSPIFRSSQESLLGRIKDRHLLPFSFREFCQYQFRHQQAFLEVIAAHRALRPALLRYDAAGALKCVGELQNALAPFAADLDQAVIAYANDGGFPEVWQLPDPVRKIEYLMEQQVRKVLYEDLMALTQYRKPENVLRFFVYLLSNPGVEINVARIARDAEVERRVVEENFPRLEMTDLIIRVQRFSNQPLRVRRGNVKTYPVDVALRNAVLKTWDWQGMPGGYLAENLVVRELTSWAEKIEVSYYRDKDREVDFVLTFGGTRHLPFEVKAGQDPAPPAGLRWFMDKYAIPLGVVITQGRDARFEDRLLYIPLTFFLLAC